ncbi:hypothetical protein [Desulfopila sp. IMCC35008]|uniref:hypothetical protein n=1 Tax=Desulfopila sp. IMCC35008 TaxID=2653858 RepID=UPI0013D3A4DB|nr:hypothetical protein [Desulfopila sp. IMCC35008]
MLFIGDFSLKAKLILLPFLFVLLFFLWRKIKRTKTSYEEFSKDKTQNSTTISWQWHSPPAEVDLEVEQSADESRLRLYSTRSSTEIFCGLAGIVFATLTLCMLLAALLNTGGNYTYTISPLGLACVTPVLLLLAYGLCSVETPVTDIILSPNRLIIRRRFAIYFHKSTTYAAHKAKGLTITANVQNILQSTVDQFYRLPDFYLYVKKGFGPSKRFILRCTPKQTGWIVEGLNQWVSFIVH